ncbi:hypothetical protein BsWGS_18822 [Bradybaena similaris]
MEKYEMVKRLAVGAHGAVYLIKHTSTKKYFALKKIEVDERRQTKTKEAVLKEARIMSQLRHPNIVLFHESFVDPAGEYVHIVLDYCDGGNLGERIQDASQSGLTFSEKQIMQGGFVGWGIMTTSPEQSPRSVQWFIQIVMAVQYIHSKHILHRDLKTENVLLNKRNVIKLGDFGISKILDNTIDVAKTVVGTPSYLSPELCQDIPYNSKSDIWAVGCLLFEMCALYPPFEGQSLIGLFFNIVKAEFRPLPDDTPAGIKDLVSQILVKTPENRPSASAILNEPYVKRHLASFIADTENICSIRSKRDLSCVTSGGDNHMLSSSGIVLGSREPVTAASRLKPAGSPRKQLCCFSPQCTTAEGSDLQSHYLTQSAESPQDNVDRENDTEYSDDFDDSSSEIEEDLPDDADKKSAEDILYVDDFEDYDSDEYLEEVVNLAKEAQVLEPVDDYFVEEDDMALSQTLTQTQFFRSHVEIFKSELAAETDC